jgi:quinone-modifying oxidoreductase subunit QmoB
MNEPGVYICRGCDIGSAVDTEKLEKVARSEYKVTVCRTEEVLCSREGVEAVRKDLSEGTIDSAVVAACSPRMKTEVFAFGPTAIVERVNLREHVAWCQKPKDEDTQMMAEDYLRMGIVKVKKSEPLAPVSEPISKKLLVVGGGATGLTAALEAAAAGYEVALVEREAQLGGFAAHMKKRFPSVPPYGELASGGIREKVHSALNHPKIQVFTSARILRIEGQPGMFDVTVLTDESTTSLRVGAIIMATGWKPYDASRLTHLGYGVIPDVVTNVDFERMASQGKLVRRSDGGAVNDILFVQCAGSRDKDHLPYCSSVCCMATLKHALYMREQNPSARVYVVYKDMRTPGQYERFYAAVQNDPFTFFAKGEVGGVENGPNGRLAVNIRNSLLGDNILISVDMVVLAVGMVPNAADGMAIRALHDAESNLKRAETETQRAEAK